MSSELEDFITTAAKRAISNARSMSLMALMPQVSSLAPPCDRDGLDHEYTANILNTLDVIRKPKYRHSIEY
jgi:hypothetical protein